MSAWQKRGYGRPDWGHVARVGEAQRTIRKGLHGIAPDHLREQEQEWTSLLSGPELFHLHWGIGGGARTRGFSHASCLMMRRIRAIGRSWRVKSVSAVAFCGNAAHSQQMYGRGHGIILALTRNTSSSSSQNRCRRAGSSASN